MKLKLIAAATLALLATGGAQAQSSALDTMMKQFYTDDSMATMKSDDEITAMMKTMTDQDKAAMKSACSNAQGPRQMEFCASASKFMDAM